MIMKRPMNTQSEKGQSLLELAVVLVFILILLAGVVDLGRMMYEYLTMRDAAQEGAGYGAIYPNDCNHLITRVMQNLPDDNYAVQIQITDVHGTAGTVTCDAAVANDYAAGRSALPYFGCMGNTLTVIIDHSTEITMPFLSAFTGPTVPMHVVIEDRIVRPGCSSTP